MNDRGGYKGGYDVARQQAMPKSGDDPRLSSSTLVESEINRIRGHIKEIHDTFDAAFTANKDNKDNRLLRVHATLYEWFVAMIDAADTVSHKNKYALQIWFEEKLKETLDSGALEKEALGEGVFLEEDEKAIIDEIRKLYQVLGVQIYLVKEVNLNEIFDRTRQEKANPFIAEYEKQKEAASALLRPYGKFQGSNPLEEANQEFAANVAEHARSLIIPIVHQLLTDQEAVVSTFTKEYEEITQPIRDLRKKIEDYNKLDATVTYEVKLNAYQTIQADSKRLNVKGLKISLDQFIRRINDALATLKTQNVSQRIDLEIKGTKVVPKDISTEKLDTIERTLDAAMGKLKAAGNALDNVWEWHADIKKTTDIALTRAREIERNAELTAELHRNKETVQTLMDTCTRLSNQFQEEFLSLQAEVTGESVTESVAEPVTEPASQLATSSSIWNASSYVIQGALNVGNSVLKGTSSVVTGSTKALAAAIFPSTQATWNAELAAEAKSKWLHAGAILGEKMGEHSHEVRQFEVKVKGALDGKDKEFRDNFTAICDNYDGQKKELTEQAHQIEAIKEGISNSKQAIQATVQYAMKCVLEEGEVIPQRSQYGGEQNPARAHTLIADSTASNRVSLEKLSSLVKSYQALPIPRIEKPKPPQKDTVEHASQLKPWKIGETIGGFIGFIGGALAGGIAGFFAGFMVGGFVTIPLGGIGAIPATILGITAGAAAGGVVGGTAGAALGHRLVDRPLMMRDERRLSAVVEKLMEEPGPSDMRAFSKRDSKRMSTHGLALSLRRTADGSDAAPSTLADRSSDDESHPENDVPMDTLGEKGKGKEKETQQKKNPRANSTVPGSQPPIVQSSLFADGSREPRADGEKRSLFSSTPGKGNGVKWG